MDDPDELLDLVDANDAIIGTIEREEILSLERSKRGFVRAVGGFIYNPLGHIWVPRRLATKKIAPSGLDFSASEHVGIGESYESAMERGFKEELNLQVDPGQLMNLGTVPPFEGMPYFHEIFLYPFADTPQYSTTDYSGGDWLKPNELLIALRQGTPAKEIVAPSVELIIDKWHYMAH
jgi:hypothetical protein